MLGKQGANSHVFQDESKSESQSTFLRPNSTLPTSQLSQLLPSRLEPVGQANDNSFFPSYFEGRPSLERLRSTRGEASSTFATTQLPLVSSLMEVPTESAHRAPSSERCFANEVGPGLLGGKNTLFRSKKDVRFSARGVVHLSMARTNAVPTGKARYQSCQSVTFKRHAGVTIFQPWTK